jgi:two-component system CheB/CheR fusion protein
MDRLLADDSELPRSLDGSPPNSHASPKSDGTRRDDAAPESVPAEDPEDAEFPVVGIGASAGGLEALEKLFGAMPENTGMAFVVVQHLSPDFKSVMDELLARRTRIPVHLVEDAMPVEPNRIYLIPPRKEMIISRGRLLLSDKGESQDGLTLPIDIFFRSLAQDMGQRAAGIVLSGAGSDGSRGIRDRGRLVSGRWRGVRRRRRVVRSGALGRAHRSRDGRVEAMARATSRRSRGRCRHDQRVRDRRR